MRADERKGEGAWKWRRGARALAWGPLARTACVDAGIPAASARDVPVYVVVAAPPAVAVYTSVTDQAINCRPEGCIASGPGCDARAVPGQCSFPRERAVELCLGHPQCVAVNCNTSRDDCQARDWTRRDAWKGMSSIVVRDD